MLNLGNFYTSLWALERCDLKTLLDLKIFKIYDFSACD